MLTAVPVGEHEPRIEERPERTVGRRL
jgi:hypothetical protein